MLRDGDGTKKVKLLNGGERNQKEGDRERRKSE